MNSRCALVFGPAGWAVRQPACLRQADKAAGRRNVYSVYRNRLLGKSHEHYAGLNDRVNNHMFKLFQAAILSSVLSVASEIGRDSDDDAIIEALRDGGQRTINQAGQEIVTRQLAVQPTITVRPGWRLRVIVNKDLVLQPYGVR